MPSFANSVAHPRKRLWLSADARLASVGPVAIHLQCNKQLFNVGLHLRPNDELFFSQVESQSSGSLADALCVIRIPEILT